MDRRKKAERELRVHDNTTFVLFSHSGILILSIFIITNIFHRESLFGNNNV
jgi:hypothetical protein